MRLDNSGVKCSYTCKHTQDSIFPLDQVIGLRTSCLKKLNELFFVYARDKYEVLSIHTLADTYTYPDEVLKLFKDGQWTMSVKGRPYHNLALDEAHECIINRKLKQITTRPSHFRMVELANFMANLDSVVSSLDLHVFKHHTVI